MKNEWFVRTLIILTLAGCAGRAPEPVRVFQIADESLNCAGIENEVRRALDQSGIDHREGMRTSRANLAKYISGQLLLFPLLTMDVTGSAQIERNALVRRLERLKELSEEKGCV